MSRQASLVKSLLLIRLSSSDITKSPLPKRFTEEASNCIEVLAGAILHRYPSLINSIISTEAATSVNREFLALCSQTPSPLNGVAVSPQTRSAGLRSVSFSIADLIMPTLSLLVRCASSIIMRSNFPIFSMRLNIVPMVPMMIDLS